LNIPEVSPCILNLIERIKSDDYEPEDSHVIIEDRFKDVPIPTRRLDHKADDSVSACTKFSPERDPHNDEIYDDENGDGVHPPVRFSQKEEEESNVEY
jgi:hypothetical protein